MIRQAFVIITIIIIQGCAGSPAVSYIQGDNTPRSYADRNLANASLSRLCDMREWKGVQPACNTVESRTGTFRTFCNNFSDAVAYEFAVRSVLPELACSSRSVRNVLRNTSVNENPYHPSRVSERPSVMPQKVQKAPDIE